MDDVKARFRIKFGLSPQEPTDEQIEKFVHELDKLVRQGVSTDEAVRRAAVASFTSLGKFAYRSQADTIHDLLLAIRNAGKR